MLTKLGGLKDGETILNLFRSSRLECLKVADKTEDIHQLKQMIQKVITKKIDRLSKMQEIINI